jgi:hypothetical protein
MSDPIIVSIVGVVGIVVGSLGGALIGALIQRDSKRNERKIGVLEQKVERYEAEIKATHAVEEVAEAWLVELGHEWSPRAAMLHLRRRTLEQRGVRPKISPGELGLP